MNIWKYMIYHTMYVLKDIVWNCLVCCGYFWDSWICPQSPTSVSKLPSRKQIYITKHVFSVVLICFKCFWDFFWFFCIWGEFGGPKWSPPLSQRQCQSSLPGEEILMNKFGGWFLWFVWKSKKWKMVLKWLCDH